MIYKEDIDRIRNSHQNKITRDNIKEIINIYQSYINDFRDINNSDIEMIYLMTKNK